MSLSNNNKCKCPMCGGQARTYEEARRYRINCISCGYDGYLKTAAMKRFVPFAIICTVKELSHFINNHGSYLDYRRAMSERPHVTEDMNYELLEEKFF